MKMSNKDILKKLYSEKMSKEANYNKVLSRVKGKDKMKYLKWSVAPVCLIAIVCGVMVFGGNKTDVLQGTDKPYMNKENIALNINNINGEVGQTKINGEIENLKEEDINLAHYDLLDLSVPEDMEDKDIYGVYPNGGNNTESKSVYNYNLVYSDANNNRSINISFSKENKPLRDYHFNDDGNKVSKINDKELKIYKYEDLYMTEFSYKGVNYDIETSNISQEEFVTLLQSIIK